MALRISSSNSETLSNMILAHRVAVRNATAAKAAEADNRFDMWECETVTEYAIDVALGQDDDGHKLRYLQDKAKQDSDIAQMDAYIALIRLNRLGVI